MSFVFTEFLQSLDASGSPGSTTDFSALWSALRNALRRELRRRGLWESSPRYLGVAGSPTWHPTKTWGYGAGSPTSWFPGDALDELTTELYLRVFVARLPSLRRHLEHKPNIDGIVHRAIGQAIHDIQKRHDPLGYRIYQVSRSALRLLIAKKELHPIDEAPRIANRTLFSFEVGASPTTRSKEILEMRARRFNDDLFPDLLVARGAELRQVVGRLAVKIRGLRDSGVRAFSFRHLIDPFKSDTRNRWGIFLASTPFGIEAFGHEARCCEGLPGDRFEARERFEKLSQCIEARIGSLDGQRRTREHRRKLWWFLHLFASDESVDSLPTIFDHETLPSNRELARLLGIPRGRLPGLFEDLAAAAETCLESLGRGSDGLASPAGSALPDPVEGDGATVCRALLARTEAAWNRPRPSVAPISRQGASEPRDVMDAAVENKAVEIPRDDEKPNAPERRSDAFFGRRRPGSRKRSWRGLRAIAAGIVLLVSAGVVLSIAHHQLRNHRPEGAVVHLMMSGDRITRGAPTYPVLELGPGDSTVVLVVAVPPEPRPAYFELRAWQSESRSWGETSWRGELDPRGELEQAVLLPADRLETGRLRLELVDLEGAEPLRTYTFEIRPVARNPAPTE